MITSPTTRVNSLQDSMLYSIVKLKVNSSPRQPFVRRMFWASISAPQSASLTSTLLEQTSRVSCPKLIQGVLAGDVGQFVWYRQYEDEFTAERQFKAHDLLQPKNRTQDTSAQGRRRRLPVQGANTYCVVRNSQTTGCNRLVDGLRSTNIHRCTATPKSTVSTGAQQPLPTPQGAELALDRNHKESMASARCDSHLRKEYDTCMESHAAKE